MAAPVPKPSDLQCSVCSKFVSKHKITGVEVLREPIQILVAKDVPTWNHESRICDRCLNKYRVQYVEQLMHTEKGDLTNLEKEVLQSIVEHEMLSENLNRVLTAESHFAHRLSDKIAKFGGSWSFIIVFITSMAAWILYNSHGNTNAAFDPYPFILLNLILSCVAALQAPIIMMSQNRQEAKDRIRNEHDYQTNLKAELEIRQLHMKIDQLLKHQWQRMLELQAVQLELLQAIKEGRK